MNSDENIINNFANSLKIHNVQQTISLYRESQSRNNTSGVEKLDIKDALSSVDKQLKAIHSADSLKREPCNKGIPPQIKKSNFLPLHMVPVEHLSVKIQPPKFETQCILDTQLIKVIEDAEAIAEAEKGISQEFNTTYCHKDFGDHSDSSLNCDEDFKKHPGLLKRIDIAVMADIDLEQNIALNENEGNHNIFYDCDKMQNEEKYIPQSQERNSIINKHQHTEKSNTPYTLIFKLESFEKFEAIALPVIENYDFETAKEVIISQIFNRELHPHDKNVNNNNFRESQNKSPILNSYVKPASLYFKDSNQNTIEDNICISSKEHNTIQNNLKELPFTCAAHKSPNDESSILDETMYVGFQTASNKCIQISTDSYNKAKNIFDNSNIEGNIAENDPSVTNAETFVGMETNNNIDQLIDVNKYYNNKDNTDYKEAYSLSQNIGKYRMNYNNRSNSQNMSNEDHTQLNSCNMTEKLYTKEVNNAKTDVQLSDIKICKNITKYCKFDKHILEEFNTVLPSNKIDEITEEVILDNGVEKSCRSCKKTEFSMNVMQDKNNDYAGFKTANNKIIQISAKALIKTNTIFENIDNNDTIFCEQTDNLKLNLQGFKTATNKPILISKQALDGSKNIFQDTENMIAKSVILKEKTSYPIDITKSNVLQDFTNESKSIPVDILFNDIRKENCQSNILKKNNISKETSLEAKKIFLDMDISSHNVKNNELINTIEGKLHHPIANKYKSNKCKGFQTARNKPVKISAAALLKSKAIFQDIDDKQDNIVKDPNDLLPYPTAHTSQNALKKFQGFKTAANKVVGVSAEALERSNKIFENISIKEHDFDNILKDNQSQPSQKVIYQGFKTAAEKSVAISMEALQKSKKIFQDIDIDSGDSESHSDCIVKEDQSCFKPCQKNILFQEFKTATNKTVGISTRALAESKKFFEDIANKKSKIENSVDDIEQEKQPYPVVNTSVNNTVKLTVESFAKSGKISQDIDNKVNNIIHDVDDGTLKDKLPCHINNSSQKNAIQESNKACNKSIKSKKNQTDEKIKNQIGIDPKRQQYFIGFNTASNKKVKVSEDSLLESRHVLQNTDFNINNENCVFKNPSSKKYSSDDNLVESVKARFESKLNRNEVISEDNISEDFNTEIMKDFEHTLYTEDFVEDVVPKSKRSGSPVLSCPKSKKRKKFVTPSMTKQFVAPTKDKKSTKTDITNTYSFIENYKRDKIYSLKDVHEIEKLRNIKDVDPYILNFDINTLLDFEFKGDRNDIDSDRWTTSKIMQYFTNSVNKRIIPEGWMENHLKMIIWKLVSYEIRFPQGMKNICTVKNVLEQLRYRYQRELYNVERPILRKILEKDEVSTKTIILCVAGICVGGVSKGSVTNGLQNIELLLTDGWYTIKASADRMIDKLVCDGKISVGTKLAIHGAELLHCEQGISPWEDTSSVRLRISGNSTRRAHWDARLGLHGSGAMLSRLSAVKPEGGRVSWLRMLVTRVYPTLYIEKFPDGSTVTRSERLENIYQMKYETERQIQMEKLYEELDKFSDQDSEDSQERECLDDRALESGSQISRLMKKCVDQDEFRANLTKTQACMLQQHELKQQDKLVQVLQIKFQELLKKRGLDTPRNVVPLVKIRVADVESDAVTRAMVTIWKPNEALQEMLKEGAWVDMYNVVPTSFRYSELQISAGRQSAFKKSKLKETEKHKLLMKTLVRQSYTIKDLQNPSMNTDYNEVDTVGLIFLIEPQTMEIDMKNQPFQNVYLTDADRNIICVNFWGGIKKSGFQHILHTGQVVACVNLQKRAGNTRRSILQYRATEFTYFTIMPKNDSVRKLTEDLKKKLSNVNIQKLMDDCVALKINYHKLKCGYTENISPYRLNISDYNLCKNKIFIDSPLVSKCTDVNFNITDLDFESTFKQTDSQDVSPQRLLKKRKMNEKIAKLKMYGEPPPLSPICMLNQSSSIIKAFKSPLTRNTTTSISSSTAASHNKCDSHVAHINCLPQNRVDKIDSSPVLKANRTNVKRASINPMKLNFSNAKETSTTDPFAEDFDCSPPLSLDIDIVK